MISIRVFCLVVTSALLVPNVSHAQSSELEPKAVTGSRILQKPEQLDIDLVRVMQKDFGKCIYRKEAVLADRFLLFSDPVSVDFDALGFEVEDLEDLIEKFSMSDCLNATMRANQSETLLKFDMRLLRPLLAEEAYLEAFDTPFMLPEDAPEFVIERVFVTSNNLQKAKSLGAFSDCVVYQSVSEADALLRSRPSSSQEMKSIKALIPALSACVVDGQEVKLTPASIRSIVAEGLWTRSYYTGSRNESADPNVSEQLVD